MKGIMHSRTKPFVPGRMITHSKPEFITLSSSQKKEPSIGKRKKNIIILFFMQIYTLS